MKTIRHSVSAFFLLLLLVSCGEGSNSFTKRGSLPYLSVYLDSVSADGQPVPRAVKDYELTDEQGRKFSTSSLRGKIFVAEFFFTSCKTICPVMNREMIRIQEKFRNNKNIVILSHTIDPDRDTVEALAAYASEHKAQKDQWYFLTGEARKIYRTAREQYTLPEPTPADSVDDFFHSSQVALVDPEGYIRGYYDATSPEEIAKLIGDIEILNKEFHP